MVTQDTGDNSIAGLPIPPKEKITRWMAHAGLAALAVVSLIKIMPFINQALSLILTGVWSIAEIGMVLAGTMIGAFTLISLWPAYKHFIESAANKMTWALFEYDPITPMVLWLKEVSQDRLELQSQFRNVSGSIAQNERTISDTLQSAEEADKKFAQAVKKFGQDSHEAEMMALEPGTLRDSAKRIEDITKPLYTIRDILKEVVEATEFTQRKAELDVKIFKQEFSSAQNVEGATNAANRVLNGRSQRKADAMQAMQIIHDKYAGSFGRLQGLRELSREAITSVDMAKGTYHQEALERLRSESRLITGNGGNSPKLLEAVPSGTVGGVSLYKVKSLDPVKR